MTGAYCANCGEDLDDKLGEVFKVNEKQKEVISINLNDLAVKIAKGEGKKKQVNISQIKEIMGLVFREMAKMNAGDVASIMARYKGRK